MAARSQQQPNEVDKADVLKLLQSTLISHKGGVPLDKINREYRNLVGDNIPYRNFGYGDLQEFLNDAKNVCKVNYGPDGTAVVRGVSSEETAHIQDMVKKQKQTKKPKPKPQRRPLNEQQHWQPPTPTEYPTTHGSSGFRHGFRPPTQQQNGFRPMMMNNRNPDQRNMSGGGSGSRFLNGGGRGSRLPGGGGNYPNNSQQMNHRLRAPQNGPHMSGGPPLRNSQQQQQPQQNTRPMSQRLGPPNGHGPPNSSKSNTNYVKMLEDYFAQMGLGTPEFKTSKMEKKQSNAGGKSSKKGSATTKFYSTVRVSKESFQTYPTEYNSEKEAEEAAAKLACDKLNIGNQFSLPPSTTVQSPGANSKDISSDVLIERVVELVGPRTNGVWSTSIEKEYGEKYGQTLPEHWTERIETYQTRPTVKKRIHIERPIQDRCIIMPFVDQTSNSDAKSPVSPGVAQASFVAKSVSPNNSATPNVMQRPRGPVPVLTGPVSGVASQVKLPELILPEEKVMWDVYVTHIFSTVEVCVRLLGDEYSTKFEDLITDMELHYYDVNKIPHVTKPVIGRIYAAMVEGEWHRVEAVSLKGIDVTCYFIDHGGEHDVLNVNLLREIEPKFLALAPQAKRVRLAGLEEYALSPT